MYQDGDPTVWATVAVQAQIVGQDRPQLAYRLELAEEETPDGMVSLDERVVLQLTPINRGKTATASIVGYAGKKDDVLLQLEEGRFQQDSIAAESDGAGFAVPFLVKSKAEQDGEMQTFEEDSATINWRMGERFADDIDGRYGAVLLHDINIPIGAPFQPVTMLPPIVTIADIAIDPTGQFAKLTVDIEDDNVERLVVYVAEVTDEQRLRSIRLVGEDKISILPAAQISPKTTVTVPIHTGLNIVRIEVTDRDEMTTQTVARFVVPDAATDPYFLVGPATVAAAGPAASVVP